MTTPGVFTTGQIAKICKVAPRTVAVWFDTGRLGGYRIPFSRDRRVPRDELVRFLKEHGLPLGPLAPPALLLAGPDRRLLERGVAPLGERVTFCAAATLFEAGLLAHAAAPAAVVLDLALGRGDCLAAARALRDAAAPPAPALFALAGEDEADEPGVLAAGFAGAWKKPFDPALLAESLLALVQFVSPRP